MTKNLAKFRLVPSSYGKDEVPETFEAQLTTRAEAAGSVYTVTFKAATAKKGVRKHYSDPNMVGCHYLVQSDSSDKKRHYTVCNVMRNEVYAEYVQALKDALRSHPTKISHVHLSHDLTNEVCVTLKNYRVPKGLSTHICT